jgi:beta-lactamase class A
MLLDQKKFILYDKEPADNISKRRRRIKISMSVLILSFSIFIFFTARNSKTVSYSTYDYSIFNKSKVRLSTAELSSQVGSKEVLSDDFSALTEHFESTNGTFSLYIRDILNNVDYSYNSDKQYYAASLYKLPIAVSILKKVETGGIELEDIIPYKHEDYSDGSGVISTYEIGTELTVDMLLKYLMRQSDNIAQNMLTREIDRQLMASSFSPVFSAEMPGTLYNENTSSAENYAKYLEALFTGNYLSPSSLSYLKDIMSSTSFDDRISKHLSSDLKFAHKIGNWGYTGSWHDCGIVYGPEVYMAVCLMSENTDFETFVSSGRETAVFINKLSGSESAFIDVLEP